MRNKLIENKINNKIFKIKKIKHGQKKIIRGLKENDVWVAFDYAIIFYSFKIDRYICIAAFIDERYAQEYYDNLIKKSGENAAKASRLEIINLYD